MAGMRIGGSAVIDPSFVPYEKNTVELWKVPMAGGTPVQLLDTTTDRVASPVASPDYSQIAYIRHVSGDEHLWVVNADGTGATEIVAERCLYPAWHPDGSHLIFCSYDNITDIDKINPDGTGRSTIYSVASDQLNRAIYNRDGSLIAFFNEDAEEVWVVDADGSNATKVGDLTLGYVPENAASWQHNADVLAFGDAGLSPGRFYKVNADGSGLTELAQEDSGLDRAYLSKFAWAPDDSKLFYPKADNAPDGHFTLWKVDADGTDAAQVSPLLEIFRVPFLVLGSRLYADTEDSADSLTTGLKSILPDGSDARTEDADSVRLEFPN